MSLIRKFAFVLLISFSTTAFGTAFLPSTPTSDYLEVLEEGYDLGFCAEWNPEFAFRGHRCCAKSLPRKKRRKNWCSPKRVKANYCDEMTEEQKLYSQNVYGDKVTDILTLIESEVDHKGQQSFCSVNNGFLAWGRRIVPTESNRILLRTPGRCIDFGTDRMVAMIEWLGRQVASAYSDQKYQGVKLLIGDVSAPRGGCLSGRWGRRGHASHTSGLDVDIGFLVAKENAKSPSGFGRQFEVKANWWLLKEMFRNPYACIRVIFLDRKLISKLARHAKGDPAWQEYRRFIRHVKSHRNHFHVRIGDHAGAPGCDTSSNPDLESKLENEGMEDGDELLELITQTQ